MNARLLVGALALLASLTVIATAATAKTKPVTSTAHYYLALGDSLSVGFQPNPAGVGKETNQGYVSDLYAVAKQKIKNLKLVELGCPGETTTSMITGTGNTVAAKLYRCDLTGGSQLKAAEAFLKAHAVKGEVPLITIDIGANDVDGCGSATSVSAAATCVSAGVASLEKNTPKILGALRKTAPKGTFTAAMNLYDPLLADQLSTDPTEQQLGALSLGLVKNVNGAIAKADADNGFVTADTAAAFDTYNTTVESTVGTSLAASGLPTVPTDVANICDLTWMCAAAPRGPNIHANRVGYATIAKAFEAVLPKTL